MCGTRASLRSVSTSAIDPVIVDSTRQRSRTSRDSLLSCLSSSPIAPARTHPGLISHQTGVIGLIPGLPRLAHRDKRDKPGATSKCKRIKNAEMKIIKGFSEEYVSDSSRVSANLITRKLNKYHGKGD